MEFTKLMYYKKFAVALSGGADSIFLLHHAINCAKKNKKDLTAITVDHKLRPESTKEAQEIYEYCYSLGVKHKTLTWNHDEIKTGIQEKARKARCKLITEYCKEAKIEIVVTGHNFNDQLEQLLISLSQGAGIYSFLMPEMTNNNGILFHKPMLDITKEEVKDYLNNNKIKWWEDSSNQKKDYLRNRIRDVAKSYLDLIDKKRLSTSFDNIKRSAKSLSEITIKFIETEVYTSDYGYAKLELLKYLDLADETRFSVLRSILSLIGRRNGEIRLDSIYELDGAIKEQKIKTQAGCKIIFQKNKIIFIRDYGRTRPDVRNEENGIWDNRFYFTKNYGEIKNLEEEDLDKILKDNESILNFDDELTRKTKKKILLSLPCCFFLEKPISIYHIYINNSGTEFKYINSLI